MFKFTSISFFFSFFLFYRFFVTIYLFNCSMITYKNKKTKRNKKLYTDTVYGQIEIHRSKLYMLLSFFLIDTSIEPWFNPIRPGLLGAAWARGGGGGTESARGP